VEAEPPRAYRLVLAARAAPLAPRTMLSRRPTGRGGARRPRWGASSNHTRVPSSWLTPQRAANRSTRCSPKPPCRGPGARGAGRHAGPVRRRRRGDRVTQGQGVCQRHRPRPRRRLRDLQLRTRRHTHRRIRAGIGPRPASSETQGPRSWAPESRAGAATWPPHADEPWRERVARLEAPDSWPRFPPSTGRKTIPLGTARVRVRLAPADSSRHLRPLALSGKCERARGTDLNVVGY